MLASLLLPRIHTVPAGFVYLRRLRTARTFGLHNFLARICIAPQRVLHNGSAKLRSYMLGLCHLREKKWNFSRMAINFYCGIVPGCSKRYFSIVNKFIWTRKKIWMKNIFLSWRNLILKKKIKTQFFENRKFQNFRQFSMENLTFSIENFRFVIGIYGKF